MAHPDDEDELLVAALAVGKTHEAAAEAAGCSRRTVTRRLADTTFRDRVAGVRREITDQAVGLLSAEMADAVLRLRHICADGENEGNRLRAAIAILEIARKLFQDFDLEERMRRLEERLGIVTPEPENLASPEGQPCP